MKTIKKIVSVALVVVILASFLILASSCVSDKYTVGICQLVTHDALDAATEGFEQALIETFAAR